MAQDTVQWQAVNTVMNRRVLDPISNYKLSRKILLQSILQVNR